MTYSRLIVLVGCLAAWWTAPVNLAAQSTSSAATSMQTWRRTSQGLSSNAALAFYRLQNVGHPSQRSFALSRPINQPATSLYSSPYYTVTTNRTVPGRPINYYPVTNTSPTGRIQTQKPFAGFQRPPNAFQRYWPYLLEAREDPQSGLVIWTLP